MNAVIRAAAAVLAVGLLSLAASTGNAAERIPFVVHVMTENDGGTGAMTMRDMAKLVYMMMASGNPAGSYKAALAAGMKTIWYEDPHRIGDIPGQMSDRPPVTALRRDSDLMRCAQGGLLDSTYSSKNGTYFGDPTSRNLIAKTNEQLTMATSHYGPVAYLWIDDSMLLTDTWADAWYCGDRPPALPSNGGNGMPGGVHGEPRNLGITYANGSAYTPRNFIANLVSFDNALTAPVLDEGACIGDGTPLGGERFDGGSTAILSVTAHNSAGVLCENFAEGWGNRQTLNGKAVDDFWRQDLNSGVHVLSAHKMFISYVYIGNEGSDNRGTVDDFDQRGYIYASFMLLFDYEHSVYKTGTWGARLPPKAPVMVLPENLLVPTEPLQTAVWPQRIDQLQRGGVYVREFASCGYAGQPIGPCAAVVNPSSSSSNPMPALQGHYGHSVTFVGNDGAFTGRHGTPDYGDTGDLKFDARPVPSSLPPAGWAILVR